MIIIYINIGRCYTSIMDAIAIDPRAAALGGQRTVLDDIFREVAELRNEVRTRWCQTWQALGQSRLAPSGLAPIFAMRLLSGTGTPQTCHVFHGMHAHDDAVAIGWALGLRPLRCRVQ